MSAFGAWARLILPIFLCWLAAAGHAADTPIFDVSFAVLTKRAEALARATPEQMRREVDILNTYFVGADGSRPIRFRFKNLTYAHELPAGTCAGLVALGDRAREYDYEELVARHAACGDTHLADPRAINIYVYDSYTRADGFDDITSHGVFNDGRPIVLLDWERLDHSVQSPEEHEMGHVFGLDHVCAPGADYETATNIMTSYDCELGGNGLRDIGFDAGQLAAIREYAGYLAASIGQASYSAAPLAGILTNSQGGYLAFLEQAADGAVVILQTDADLLRGKVFVGRRDGATLTATALDDARVLSAQTGIGSFFGTLDADGGPRFIGGQTLLAGATGTFDGIWQSTTDGNRYFAAVAIDAADGLLALDIALDAARRPAYDIALGTAISGAAPSFSGRSLVSGKTVAIAIGGNSPMLATYAAYADESRQQLLDRFEARRIFAVGETTATATR